jgi:hypothetical protein
VKNTNRNLKPRGREHIKADVLFVLFTQTYYHPSDVVRLSYIVQCILNNLSRLSHTCNAQEACTSVRQSLTTPQVERVTFIDVQRVQ